MNRMLYKYRGTKNFKFFVDILLKNRLYAAKYTDLNDPMEGHFYASGDLGRDLKQNLKTGKGELRICSLSRVEDNELMWSHYSDGHRGVVIGIEPDPRKYYDIRPIKYRGLPSINKENINSNSPKEILSHKLEVWQYEEEERIFTEGKDYVDVFVKQIITGRRMSNSDFGFIRDLVQRINPEIELIKADTFM